MGRMAGAPAQITAVCVVNEVLPSPKGEIKTTAIDKRPVAGPVLVDELGLVGDTQIDRRHHGGIDRAVYVYAGEDAALWAGELGREISPGGFGENLRTSGIDVNAALIGERWAIGERLVVEVTSPRIPCGVFAGFIGERSWVKRFTDARRLGVYLRVVVPGPVCAGDQLVVLSRPNHQVPVGELFPDPDPGSMQALLDADARGEIVLADHWRSQVETVAGRR
jgi:MOSC domain-containing protein YiiM